MNDKAQTNGAEMAIFTKLLGQKEGLLGQWPTSYNVKRCPGSYCFFQAIHFKILHLTFYTNLKDKSGVYEIIVKKQAYQLSNTNHEFFQVVTTLTAINTFKIFHE